MHVDGFRFDLAPVLARELYDVDKLSAFFDIIQQDPDARRREADRRAVGRGPGRLPGGQLPGALGGVERQVPRRACGSSGGARRARCRRWRAALAGSSDIYSAERPRRVREHQLRHRARRLHAARPRELRAEAQRGERREQPATATTTTSAATGASRARRTTRRSSSCATALMRTFLATLAFSQGVPMLAHGDEIGAHAEGQQQRLRAGQRDHLGGLGPRPSAAGAAAASRASCSRSGRRTPCCGAGTSSAARRSTGSKQKDVTWLRPDGKRADGRGLAATPTAQCSAC